MDFYESPYSIRYGSDAMRRLWSERNRRLLWRRVWVALAEAQSQFGLVTAEQLDDLRKHEGELRLKRALEIEKEIGHDVMAEVRAFAEICPVGGGIIHWGATSADITDNADALRMRAAMDLILAELADLLRAFADRIDSLAGFVVLGYTHLQPAEPITLGYRLALYGQDLLDHYGALRETRNGIRGKGMKGAVGSGAAYGEILAGKEVSAHPGLPRAGGTGRSGRFAAQVRVRPPDHAVGRLRRGARADGRQAGGFQRDAVQAQPGQI
jgi:adenylosuccinate lyase